MGDHIFVDMPSLRKLKFMDRSSYVVSVDTCRGCFMNENEPLLPEEIIPVYDDGIIVVRQDAEWPVPGFYVVSIRPHIGAIDEMSDEVYLKLCKILRLTRQGQRQVLGVSQIHMIQEEKLKLAHFHVWMLPLWQCILEKYNINPRVYESNIKEYIDLFEYEYNKDTIFEYNKKMTSFFNSFHL